MLKQTAETSSAPENHTKKREEGRTAENADFPSPSCLFFLSLFSIFISPHITFLRSSPFRVYFPGLFFCSPTMSSVASVSPFPAAAFLHILFSADSSESGSSCSGTKGRRWRIEKSGGGNAPESLRTGENKWILFSMGLQNELF